MPISLHITCDNPLCPGNDLPTDNRAAWMTVTSATPEVITEYIYCSPECAGSLGTALALRATDKPPDKLPEGGEE